MSRALACFSGVSGVILMQDYRIQREVTTALLLSIATVLCGCNNSSDTKQAATRPSTAPTFLSRFEQVGAADSKTAEAKLIVCLFTRTDCPISNSYAPEVRRMYEKFSPRGVAFYLVY